MILDTNQEKINIMTLRKALDYFKRMASDSNNKTEIKVYKEFIRILSKLEDKSLSGSEIKDIENELERFDLYNNSTHHKKYYAKALAQFEKYLKDHFSLTTEGYYTKIGIALGMTFGLLFGVVSLSSLGRSTGIAIGLSLGMAVGLFIGRHLDKKTLSEGKTI